MAREINRSAMLVRPYTVDFEPLLVLLPGRHITVLRHDTSEYYYACVTDDGVEFDCAEVIESKDFDDARDYDPNVDIVVDYLPP